MPIPPSAESDAQPSLLDQDFDSIPDRGSEAPDEIGPDYSAAAYGGADYGGAGELPEFDEPLRPINWNLLTSEEAHAEWLDLNAWVDWLRRTYGLPPTVIPPLWHRHDELVWELSALHLHWLNSYDPESSASSPLMWHRDFADARGRLREWVATSGTRLDRDRATRQTTWPGEPAGQPSVETVIADRDADFVQFVREDLAARLRAEEEVAQTTS